MLIKAAPKLDGHLFGQSVVLLLEHGSDGAQGVILGREIDGASANRWSVPGSQDIVVRHFHGGPVDTQGAI